ncbi:hypothetical protein ScPMuIL_001303 [Solemya velum]
MLDTIVCLVLGFSLRMILILYGEWQDRVMEVKYTDVDYFVFTDAARYLSQGKSPYERPTYRYTPLLAWLLQPNIQWSPIFGKILFILFDTLTGLLIYTILCQHNIKKRTALICSSLWLFNPLPAAVSSRGNAESLISFLVLLTMDLLSRKQVFCAAVIYAFSVHFKIYPITYSLPIYLSLETRTDRDDGLNTLQGGILHSIKRNVWPNRAQILFVATCLSVLVVLTILFHARYGWEFVHETYLYHVIRQDIRHNFSPYFYMLYLVAESPYSRLMSLLAFLPQVVLLFLISFKFYHSLPLCWFLQTFIFVTFNKVCTSQYFLWYLSILPLLVPYIKLSCARAVTTVLLWFTGQGLWLLPAYYLEFEGQNTFLWLWSAGLLFFVTNIYITLTIIDGYKLHDKSQALTSSISIKQKIK